MANPYHDSEGRFCSKGEMQTAIKTLAQKGDLDGYFKLRTEYEQIESNKVVLSKEFVAKVTSSGLQTKTDDPEEIAAVYSSIKDQLQKEGRANFWFSQYAVNLSLIHI